MFSNAIASVFRYTEGAKLGTRNFDYGRLGSIYSLPILVLFTQLRRDVFFFKYRYE